MLDPYRFALFVAAALTLLLVPGPAVLYVVARSVDQGRRAGLVSVLGISTGTLFHIGAATFGLSALLVSSARAFQAVKYAGAVYLILLGVQKFLGSESAGLPTATGASSLRRIYYQGVVVNVLNPKTAIFFLAFFPQFVDPRRGRVPVQFLLLGVVFVLMSLTTDSTYAILASAAHGVLRNSRKAFAASRYLTGTIYISLGLAAAFASPGKPAK